MSESQPTSEVIRLARPSDLRRVAPIEASGVALFRDLFGDDMAPALAGAPTSGHERDASGTLLVVAVDRTLVGFAHVVDHDQSGQTAHLEQVSVLPAYGRRGIGTRLVRAAMEEARWLGYDEMSLTTYRDVPWNGPFYAGLGFTEVAEPASWQQRMLVHERGLGLEQNGVRVVMSRRLERDDTP